MKESKSCPRWNIGFAHQIWPCSARDSKLKPSIQQTIAVFKSVQMAHRMGAPHGVAIMYGRRQIIFVASAEDFGTYSPLTFALLSLRSGRDNPNIDSKIFFEITCLGAKQLITLRGVCSIVKAAPYPNRGNTVTDPGSTSLATFFVLSFVGLHQFDAGLHQVDRGCD